MKYVLRMADMLLKCGICIHDDSGAFVLGIVYLREGSPPAKEAEVVPPYMAPSCTFMDQGTQFTKCHCMWSLIVNTYVVDAINCSK